MLQILVYLSSLPHYLSDFKNMVVEVVVGG